VIFSNTCFSEHFPAPHALMFDPLKREASTRAYLSKTVQLKWKNSQQWAQINLCMIHLIWFLKLVSNKSLKCETVGNCIWKILTQKTIKVLLELTQNERIVP